MFEQTFKNIDDILWKDSGADSELDYIGQTSWILFLRYLDDLEQDRNNFQSIVDKTNACLTPSQRDEIDKLLAHFAEMDTQQAELVATLYAAWNNLLLQNLAVSDEAIVYEARENWHENKLKIPRDSFLETLKWMRREDVNLVPKGRGKLVTEKVGG